MREPRVIQGARASLFERLTAFSARPGDRNLSTQSYLSLVASVGQELSRLLNTRCHLPEVLPNPAADTVLGYGIPDLTGFCPGNESDQARLAELLERKISAFEPRLCDVRVVLESASASPSAMAGRVIASLRIGSVVEQVVFPLSVGRDGMRVGEALPEIAV